MQAAGVTTGEYDLAARLEEADRAIRRAKLEEEIRQLDGIVMSAASDSDGAPEIVNAFLERVIAWETAPRITHRAWLERHGWSFPAPEAVGGRRLNRELWRLIDALAVARVFLYHTNHLSDAELYARLWRETLEGECPDFARTRDDACHWDFADAGAGDQEIWLAHYAREKERREWKRDFPDMALPPRQRLPHRRDHRLPVRD
ncbi:MAG TPA: hypothetical protein VMM36_09135 [Opitutaceae bacterium]|nr:hypothetical protein [Opitutaceae bacterium]